MRAPLNNYPNSAALGAGTSAPGQLRFDTVHAPMEPQERFAALVEEFAGLPDVEVPGKLSRPRFGSYALKVNGSIFAMITAGRLVVKLPTDRVDALIGGGTGMPFHSGKGRPMKQWLTVADDDAGTWLSLAREALSFVRSQSRRG